MEALKDMLLPPGLGHLRAHLLESCRRSWLGDRPAPARPEPDEARVSGAGCVRPAEIDWSRPVALLADIHANWPALQSVSRELETRGIDQCLCLGDTVGYGPHPKECVAWVRRHCHVCIRGNHDHFVGHGQGRVAMSNTARIVAEWTRTRLSDDELRWLGDLPLKWAQENCLAVHGAPMDRSCFNGYVYETTWENNLDYLAGTDFRRCLIGHSHLQGVWFAGADGARGKTERTGRHDLAAWTLAIVNPGSVGQPRNGRAGAQFAILDLETQTLELARADYDMNEVIRDIRREGLPEQLGSRLLNGR